MRKLTLPSALTVALAVFAGACRSAPPEPKRYELRGQILSLRPDVGEVQIKHEAIPGYMDAMTMSFGVKDRALLQVRAPGDLVRGTLMVTDTDAWLATLQKTGTAPLPAAEPETSAPAPVVDLLEPGQQVPDEGLVDQDGKPWRPAALAGKAYALTFIYTRCPLPTYCPLVNRNFRAAQQLVAAPHRGGQPARAPFVRRAARRRLRAEALRSAVELRDVLVGRPRRTARHRHDAAFPAAPSPPEGRSGREDERPGEADRVLPRSGRAGADPLHAARRRPLVEPGLRGRGLPRRLPRGADARGRGPHGRALQRDPVGASLDPRLVLRRRHRGSPHRRAAEGARHPGVVARAPRSPDLRGPAGQRRQRSRRSGGSRRAGAGANPPARRARGGPRPRLTRSA